MGTVWWGCARYKPSVFLGRNLGIWVASYPRMSLHCQLHFGTRAALILSWLHGSLPCGMFNQAVSHPLLPTSCLPCGVLHLAPPPKPRAGRTVKFRSG